MAGAFADSKGRYGYRRIKAVLKTGVSEKVVRRIMAEEGLVAHVPKRRRYGSYEGETTPAPANLVDRDFTAERPNEKWEEHTRNEVLALVDEYIRWYNHERIKQSLGWMSPVQYRQSQGMAA